MNAIQLEFPLMNDETDPKLAAMRQEMDAMRESMGKVRRRMFSELGEIKKTCSTLYIENEKNKEEIRRLKNEKTDWIYGQGDCLFDVREHKTT